MLVALSTAFFLSMLLIVGAIAYSIWSREAAVAVPGGPILASPQHTEEPGGEDSPEWLRMLTNIGSRIPASEQDRSQVRRDLASAGIRHNWAVPVVFGSRVVSSVVLPVATFASFYALNVDSLLLVPLTVMAGFLGYRLPDRHLAAVITRRRDAIRQGLPDLLDLLVISVDSGLSLDNAIQGTARDLAAVHPVLSDELSVFQLEVRAGTQRSEALRNMGQRTREPEMRKLASLLIQADRFGASIQKVLRTQARYMRTRRRQRAEELAHKVGVKMIFPIFFLIMPSMFLVTAGPAVLQLITRFRGLANSL